MFELSPDIHVDSGKYNPIPPVGISNINATNGHNKQNKHIENIIIHLSLSTKELRNG